jgi:putative ABC transport system permease protein
VLRNTLKAAWAHKRRLVSTTIAVVLGVAFMTGTLLLSNTLDRSFDEFFGEALSETDAVVRGPLLIETGFGSFHAPIDEDLADVVASVDGVVAVARFVETTGARVLDREGEPIGNTGGPPTLIQAWVDDEALSGIKLAEGRGPQTSREVALNVRAARDAELQVGDDIEIVLADGTSTFTLVGTYRFGDRDSAIGAVTANFTLPVVQKINGTPGQLTSISARAAEGVGQDELVERITAALPNDTELVIQTGDVFTDEISRSVSQGLGFFTNLLLVFAFIALTVGAFIIFNTFSILVAQRGKELALFRAIGASKRQVLVSVLVEAALIGLVAAVIGIGVGVLLGIGALAGLSAIGLDLPPSSAVVTRGAVLMALVVGMAVTLGSALVPAWRATRVPPLAALRDVAQDTSARSRLRLIFGLVLVAIAVWIALPAFADEPDTSAIQAVGFASLALLLALIVLGPVIAQPLAKGIGAFLPRLKGTTGLLARENAARSPKRTAATAAALMIGVGLIVFINVFTASARATIDAEFSQGLRAEYIAQVRGFDLGIPLSFADEARAIEGVDPVASLQGDLVSFERPDGETSNTFIEAVDPADFQRAVRVDMVEGTLDDLVPGTMVYDHRLARNHGVTVGDEVIVTFLTGDSATFTVVALSDAVQLLGDRTITQQDWATYNQNPTDQVAFILLDERADFAAVGEALTDLAESYPTVEVQNQEEFLGGVANTINAILNVVYGLLALSIIIALIGIANTLSLSIHERTRELGLLRAVGMTRSQVRSAVRWEAVIISLIGTGLGVGLGLLTSFALAQSLRAEGFTEFEVPVTPLVVIALIFAVLGVVASLLPSRRAARLDVLDAIATE